MNKILYSIIFSLLPLTQIVHGQTQPGIAATKTPIKTRETKTDYPNLKTQAEEVSKATAEGNFAKVLEFTYPKVIERFGGKAKMIAFLENDSAQMKAEGFELEVVNVGEIKQIAKVENELFAIVPITMKIKSPQGKALGESSLVGISIDNGANCKFIDGINQERFKSIFPKAAEKIQIPAEQAPKPIENE